MVQNCQVLLTNIGAKACTTLGSMGPRLAVGDTKYEDFNAEAEDSEVSEQVMVTFRCL